MQRGERRSEIMQSASKKVASIYIIFLQFDIDFKNILK